MYNIPKDQPVYAKFDITGKVSTFDYSCLISKMGTPDKRADLNYDGIVNQADLNILLSNFNK